MSVQIIGSYTFWAEYWNGPDEGREMFSCATDDGEAIGFAAETVRAGESNRVHVRRGGEYVAEVYSGYQKSIHVELHRENGEVIQFELPCFALLAAHYLRAGALAHRA